MVYIDYCVGILKNNRETVIELLQSGHFLKQKNEQIEERREGL
jgi:hypothetical protein